MKGTVAPGPVGRVPVTDFVTVNEPLLRVVGFSSATATVVPSPIVIRAVPATVVTPSPLHAGALQVTPVIAAGVVSRNCTFVP